MRRFRPILTARWGLTLVLVLAAMLTCIALGKWQWHRFESRSHSVAAVEKNFDSAPTALEPVLESERSQLPPEDDYRVIEVRGRYCTRPECDLYVRNRTMGSSVGFWQLVPFTSNTGKTLLVVRGWVEGASTESKPASSPPVPQGEVTLTARLRPIEPHLTERGEVKGQVQSVNPRDVSSEAGSLPRIYEGAYAVASKEVQGSQEQPLPRPLPKPETTRGPHLSYAVQWWAFALLFPLGFVIAVRRELADAQSSDVPRQRQRPQKRSNEDEEDALLDEREHP